MRKGQKHSKASRLKMSKSRKGICWRGKGWHHPEATKRKISKVSKGQHHSPETEFKKGHQIWLGKHHTEESKKRISKARIGKHYPKLRKALKGKKATSGSFQKGMIPWNKGKKYPQISGDKNPNWKGGITSETVKIRRSLKAKLWREAIFTENKFACQKCGNSKGGNLEAHHKLNFADYPELQFVGENGITFCEECHKKFHKKYGYKNNTKKQLVEFLKKSKQKI